MTQLSEQRTPFVELCDQFGWDGPAAILRVYAATAERIGESPELSDRQVRNWRSPNPPCPRPGRQRVLEAMLGVPLEQAGFDVPREARALAQLDDSPAARTTLARAARLYEQDRGTRPAPDWTAFHGPAELANAQAQLFSFAGHHSAAVTWLRKALERQEATYARNEALGRGALAAALARSGEPEEAAYQLTEGEALLSEVSSGRARETLAQARHELARLRSCMPIDHVDGSDRTAALSG